MLRTWLKSRLKAKHHNSPKRDRHAKLSFEHLETKSLLTTLVVDINNPTADQPGDNLYAQIQDAVDAAEEGDVIKVHSGTYKPFYVLKSNLTIREAKWHSNPVVDIRLGTAPIFSQGAAIRVSGSNNTIKGFTVDNVSGSSTSELLENRGFLISGQRHRLVDNSNLGGGTGFRIYGTDHKLTGNTTSGSAFHGFLFPHGRDTLVLRNKAIDSGWAGFQITNASHITLHLNRAEQNVNGFIIFGEENLLTHNAATDNSVGFVIGGSENNVHRNVATDSILGFALLGDGRSTSLIGNIAKNSEMEGFRVESRGATIRGNWAINNGGEGFDVSTEDNTVGRNWVFTKEDGLMLFGSDENHSSSRRSTLGSWSRLVDAVMDNDGERESLLGRRSRRFGRA